MVYTYMDTFLRTLYGVIFGGMISGRVIRKRKRIGSQAEVAAMLGVSRYTISRLELDPLPPLLLRYLALVGYNVSFYPKSNREELTK